VNRGEGVDHLHLRDGMCGF